MDMKLDWKWILARGVLGVLFGTLLVAFPASGVATLAFLFGAYLAVDGAVALYSAWLEKDQKRVRLLMTLEGVLGVIAGAIAIMYPTIALVVLVSLAAVWAISTGAVEIYFAYKFRKSIPSALLLGLAGVVSFVFAAFLIERPDSGVFALLIMIASYSVAFGAVLIAWAVRLRSLGFKKGVIHIDSVATV